MVVENLIKMGDDIGVGGPGGGGGGGVGGGKRGRKRRKGLNARFLDLASRVGATVGTCPPHRLGVHRTTVPVPVPIPVQSINDNINDYINDDDNDGQ